MSVQAWLCLPLYIGQTAFLAPKTLSILPPLALPLRIHTFYIQLTCHVCSLNDKFIANQLSGNGIVFTLQCKQSILIHVHRYGLPTLLYVSPTLCVCECITYAYPYVPVIYQYMENFGGLWWFTIVSAPSIISCKMIFYSFTTQLSDNTYRFIHSDVICIWIAINFSPCLISLCPLFYVWRKKKKQRCELDSHIMHVQTRRNFNLAQWIRR